MKFKKGVQTEIDASYLYKKLAEHEDDSTIASVFRQMSEIEKGHAAAFIKKNENKEVIISPSWRARLLNFIGRVFGYDYLLGVLMDTEKSISYATIESKKQHSRSLTGTENNHVNILRAILERQSIVTGSQLSKFERMHRSIGGNAIRAAVLGGNDGLVSNFSLVMGVAAGGVYNHIETEKREDHYNSDSGHKFGWQIESGVLFRISPKLLVKPGLRYRNLQAARLQYFSIGTGFFFGR